MQRDFLSFHDDRPRPEPRYCSHCGRPAENTFCSSCGRPLVGTSDPQPTADYAGEVCFERVAASPEVRARVQASVARSKKRLSGEEFLAVAGSVMSLGVPLDKIAGVVQPMYARWGVKTGKEQQQWVPTPVGETLVRVLCSLAERGQELQGVEQATDACTLIATFPSDLWALEGRLAVTVSRAPDGSVVTAATRIEGQYFDWGKSRRGLERLFDDLRRAA